MNNSIATLGRAAGFVGILLCVASSIARLAGMHWIGSFETVTVLQAGVAGMTLGCFCLLFVLTRDIGK
ncbi:MAG: hypothetical protein Q8S26_18710 [Azonexus sp.]|nr:hypothetical protein [Azonexus sp.]